MTNNKLQKLFVAAQKTGMTVAQFGQLVRQTPHNLSIDTAAAVARRYRDFLEFPPTPAPKEVPQSSASEEKPAGSLSIINRSAVKAYALKVSKEKRAGKFTRVSGEFLDGVQAALEAKIRAIPQVVSSDDVAPDADADWFVNGRTVRMVEEQLNAAVRAIVWVKVHRHPSTGVTLK